jgi:hypothetical protein
MKNDYLRSTRKRQSKLDQHTVSGKLRAKITACANKSTANTEPLKERHRVSQGRHRRVRAT